MKSSLSAFARRRPIVLLFSIGLALAAGACSGDDDPTAATETARVRILLTDAPADMLDTAHVWISRVYLTGPGESSVDTTDADSTSTDQLPAGRKDLFTGEDGPLLFDLLQLRDGQTADLTGLVDVEATTWNGLRFVVDSTRVTLADGYTFEDGTRQAAFRVPSGSQSGIKVKMRDLIDVTDAGETTITVDFDVDQNFRIQMAPQSDSVVRRVQFQPVLRELSRTR